QSWRSICSSVLRFQKAVTTCAISSLLPQPVCKPLNQLPQPEGPVQLGPGIVPAQDRNAQFVLRHERRVLGDIHLSDHNAVAFQRTGELQAFLAQMAGGGSEQGQ